MEREKSKLQRRSELTMFQPRLRTPQSPEDVLDSGLFGLTHSRENNQRSLHLAPSFPNSSRMSGSRSVAQTNLYKIPQRGLLLPEIFMCKWGEIALLYLTGVLGRDYIKDFKVFSLHKGHTSVYCFAGFETISLAFADHHTSLPSDTCPMTQCKYVERPLPRSY